MSEIANTKPKNTRIVGIDFGLARLGVAWSDERKIIAMPLVVVKASKQVNTTVREILDYINKAATSERCEISAIVVGLPLMMDGKVGLLADEVKIFKEHLEKATAIPIILWDERLTSVQAERALRESGMSRKKRTKHVDTVAATIILQNYLDSINLSNEVR